MRSLRTGAPTISNEKRSFRQLVNQHPACFGGKHRRLVWWENQLWQI
jgi:hypothetical protein